MIVCVHAKLLQSCLTVSLWTVACQAPLSMGFSRQEYWSGFPCPPPGDLPDPGIQPTSLLSPALAVGFITSSAIWKAPKKTSTIEDRFFIQSNETVTKIN